MVYALFCCGHLKFNFSSQTHWLIETFLMTCVRHENHAVLINFMAHKADNRKRILYDT